MIPQGDIEKLLDDFPCGHNLSWGVAVLHSACRTGFSVFSVIYSDWRVEAQRSVDDLSWNAGVQLRFNLSLRPDPNPDQITHEFRQWCHIAFTARLMPHSIRLAMPSANTVLRSGSRTRTTCMAGYVKCGGCRPGLGAPLCSAKTSTTYCMWARCTATRSRLRHVVQPMSTTTYEEIYRAICHRDV